MKNVGKGVTGRPEGAMYVAVLRAKAEALDRFEKLLHDEVKNDAWMCMRKMDDVAVRYTTLKDLLKKAKKGEK